jgi:hypothetical protein
MKKFLQRNILALLFLAPLGALAAPPKIAPRLASFEAAKAQLGAPTKELIPGARYRFLAPAGSGFSVIDLYVGRESKAIELAEYQYEQPVDPKEARAMLGQKLPDLTYQRADGTTAEIFLLQSARLVLSAEKKVLSVSYLSEEALRTIITEVSPVGVTRESPEQAFLGLQLALITKREAQLSVVVGQAMKLEDLMKEREALSLSLREAKLISLKKSKKLCTIKVQFTAASEVTFIFSLQDGEWVLASIKHNESKPSMLRGAP